MKWLYGKKKMPNAVNGSTAQEKVTNGIVSAWLRYHIKWAYLMQRYANRLSRNGKLITLFLFCLIGASLSLCLMFGSVMYQTTSLFTITHYKSTSVAGKNGDEHTKAYVIITKNEFAKVQRFRSYMDSLARSPSGKKVFDSIVNKRPGLTDSVLLIENMYQSQNKR